MTGARASVLKINVARAPAWVTTLKHRKAMFKSLGQASLPQSVDPGWEAGFQMQRRHVLHDLPVVAQEVCGGAGI